VTYPTIQLPSGMHGRSCAIQVVVRIAPCAPRSVLSFGSDQSSGTRQSTHTRSEPVPRNSLSLSWQDCPLPDHLAKVNAPGLSLRLIAQSSPNPFDPTARPRRLVSPRLREFNTADPLSGSLSTTSTALQAATSVQGFWTLPDQSVDLNTNREVHRIDTPDCPSLPAACCFNRTSNGSTFQTRYVPFGLLSNKPLGTFFTMLLIASLVNNKVIILTCFCTRF